MNKKKPTPNIDSSSRSSQRGFREYYIFGDQPATDSICVIGHNSEFQNDLPRITEKSQTKQQFLLELQGSIPNESLPSATKDLFELKEGDKTAEI